MANIYIRLPISRCQFYRNRDARKPLKPNEPVVFSECSEKYYILKTSIYNKARNKVVDSRFFSHQEWSNMSRGIPPAGGSQVMQRDRKEWLAYDEIINIMGIKQNDKSNLYDYLCIKLPTEVYCIDVVRPVTPTWTIDIHGYNCLVTAINNDFKRTVVDWALKTFDFCTQDGRVILRAQQAMLERFLIRYDIDVSVYEKDNLRRVLIRWLTQECCDFSSYSNLNIRYTDAKEKTIKIDDIEII